MPSAQIRMSTAAIEEKLRAIAGAPFVRGAMSGDASQYLIVEPADNQEVAAVLQCANNDGAIVIPRGGGTKHDWGNPLSAADIVLSTTRLNRVLEHPWADLTVTVQVGPGMFEDSIEACCGKDYVSGRERISPVVLGAAAPRNHDGAVIVGALKDRSYFLVVRRFDDQVL